MPRSRLLPPADLAAPGRAGSAPEPPPTRPGGCSSASPAHPEPARRPSPRTSLRRSPTAVPPPRPASPTCRWTASTSPTCSWTRSGCGSARGRRRPSTPTATWRPCGGCARTTRPRSTSRASSASWSSPSPPRSPCRRRRRSSSARGTTCSSTTSRGRGCGRSSTRSGSSTSPTTSGCGGSSTRHTRFGKDTDAARTVGPRARPGQRRPRPGHPGARRSRRRRP